MDRIKVFLDGLYKKNRALAAGVTYFLVLILVESSSAYVFNQSKKLERVNELSLKNNERIKSLEKENNMVVLKTNNIVTRNSFNAYIARKDDEYHRQQAFNDKITLKSGLLEGRFSVVEQLFYDLNRSQLQERVNNGTHRNNTANH